MRDVHLLENLGYLRRLNDGQNSFEARRIIKAIMTAEWIAEYQHKVLAATTSTSAPAGSGRVDEPGSDAAVAPSLPQADA